jgi:transposase InsO family protein
MLGCLAERIWKHPIHGGEIQLAAATIERWYYAAKKERHDPVTALQRNIRKDAGRVTLAPHVIAALERQYASHPHWTYQLHYDNLVALSKEDVALGRMRSYSTVRRYMQAHGMKRRARPRPKGKPGEIRAAVRRQAREVRSYETEYVGSLWHLDFHHASLPVLCQDGQRRRPLALGILDDHSRLCCHLQWYLSETAEDLVHGLSQAIQKRGLPRALMTDNGAAMVAAEFQEGLQRLGILHEKTLPYSPHQNGKQESFWGHLEGRLMEMLEQQADLTLEFLNLATQAWVEVEYNRTVHRELGVSPLTRFAQSPSVLRDSPSSEALRNAFRCDAARRQRQSDGTITLEGKRFEIPARYRHFAKVVVRYARWDLGRVDLMDPRQDSILSPIYLLDRVANANGHRVPTAPDHTSEPSTPHTPANELPPLLKHLLAEYSATGVPPSYVPKNSAPTKGQA